MIQPLIGPRKCRAPAGAPGGRRDAGPPRKAHHPDGGPCPNPPTRAAATGSSSGRAGVNVATAPVFGTESAPHQQATLRRAADVRAQSRPVASAWPRADEPPPPPDRSPRTASSVIVASLSATRSASPPDPRPFGILVARNVHPRSLACVSAGRPAVLGPTPSRLARRDAARRPPGCRCFRARRPSGCDNGARAPHAQPLR
jgi:hypothetical protein